MKRRFFSFPVIYTACWAQIHSQLDVVLGGCKASAPTLIHPHQLYELGGIFVFVQTIDKFQNPTELFLRDVGSGVGGAAPEFSLKLGIRQGFTRRPGGRRRFPYPGAPIGPSTPTDPLPALTPA